MMVCQSAFAYDYYVNGIYYRKATQQLPGGGCGETYLIVVNDDDPNTYSGDVVIPETEIINGESLRVRYIGSEAFYGCVNLTSVTLPNTIVNIGFHSFADCHLLEVIDIPASIQQINSNAFSNCYELDHIFIHSTEPFFLWDDAFAECPFIEVIDLPAGMVQINSFAFSYCPRLDYIFIHDTEPFFLWDDALANINDHVNIVVPCNCIEAFEAAEEWQGIQLYDDCGNVGIGEAKAVAFDVYPNPVSGALTIEAEGLVTISDEMGRVVRSLFVDDKQTIDLQGLSSGLYFVKVGTEVKKVMVK